MSGLTEGCIPSEFHNTKRHAVEPQSGELEGAGGDMSQLIQHLDAAYNLARWLVRSEADAEDLVQEAYLRAVRSFHTLRRTESRPWMLAIVRNCCYDWLRRRGLSPLRKASAEEVDAFEADAPSPEAMVLQKEDAAAVRDALDRLPPHDVPDFASSSRPKIYKLSLCHGCEIPTPVHVPGIRQQY